MIQLSETGRSTTEDEIVRKFQARRRRTFWFGWPLVFIGWGGVVLSIAILKSFDAIILIAFPGFALGIAGIVIVHYLTRCPACNKQPYVYEVGGGTGVVLDPAACPNCGARLK